MELVDRIDECPIAPEMWPGVLDELGRIAEGTGGSLIITDPEVQYWTASPGTKERAERIGFKAERWFWRGQFAARVLAARHAGFLTDLDLFTRDELDLIPTGLIFDSEGDSRIGETLTHCHRRKGGGDGGNRNYALGFDSERVAGGVSKGLRRKVGPADAGDRPGT